MHSTKLELKMKEKTVQDRIILDRKNGDEGKKNDHKNRLCLLIARLERERKKGK